MTETLLGQHIDAGICGQRDQFEALRMARNNIEGADADGTAGAEYGPLDSAAMAATVKRSYAIWGKKVADAGIQPE